MTHKLHAKVYLIFYQPLGPGLQQATVAATAQTHSSTSQSNASSTATLAEAAAAPSALER